MPFSVSFSSVSHATNVDAAMIKERAISKILLSVFICLILSFVCSVRYDILFMAINQVHFENFLYSGAFLLTLKQINVIIG